MNWARRLDRYIPGQTLLTYWRCVTGYHVAGRYNSAGKLVCISCGRPQFKKGQKRCGLPEID